jgi:hypothetical protein
VIKRSKPQRRRFQRADHRRTISLERGLNGRIKRLVVEFGKPYLVELRLSRTRRLMHNEIQRWTQGHELPDRRTQGQCNTPYSLTTRDKRSVAAGRVVARIFVNAQDLRDNAAEVLAHECTHAGMGWVRFRRTSLEQMPGEEVLAHAVGNLHWQACVATRLYGVW